MRWKSPIKVPMVKTKVNHVRRPKSSMNRLRIYFCEIFRKLLQIASAIRWTLTVVVHCWLRKLSQLFNRNSATSCHLLSHHKWDQKGCTLFTLFCKFKKINSFYLFILKIFHRDTQQDSSRSPTPLTQPNLLQQQLQQQLRVNNHHNGRSKRFSSPAYSDYGYSEKINSRNVNGKAGKRNIRSMNEAIEVLADQVEEENLVSCWVMFEYFFSVISREQFSFFFVYYQCLSVNKWGRRKKKFLLVSCANLISKMRIYSRSNVDFGCMRICGDEEEKIMNEFEFLLFFCVNLINCRFNLIKIWWVV